MPDLATAIVRLADPRASVRDQGRALLATVIVDKRLNRYEVMIDAPPAPAMTFDRTVARMLGEDVASGAPRLD